MTRQRTFSTCRSHLIQNTLAKMSSICSQLVSASVVSVNIQSINARSSSRNGIARNLHHVFISVKNDATQHHTTSVQQLVLLQTMYHDTMPTTHAHGDGTELHIIIIYFTFQIYFIWHGNFRGYKQFKNMLQSV